MRTNKIIFSIIFIIINTLFYCGQQTTKNPPIAPVKNVVDEYYGVKVEDPYRYMENLEDPEVQSWIKGQAEYAAE
ncbi:MAG: hypothetical protein QQN62_07875, partial [Nitrosopumilus sp.]